MIIIADLARGYYKKIVMITGRYGKRRNVLAHVLSESCESINLHFLYGKISILIYNNVLKRKFSEVSG